MCARRCSVLYVVPYVHSDNSWRLHSRRRTAAYLYEEQHSSPTSLLQPPDASLFSQRGAWVTTISASRLYILAEDVLNKRCLLHSRFTGSYNYGSYSNQHPHSIQTQYPSLTHESAITAPLHYSAYHRSSAQVSPSHREPCDFAWQYIHAIQLFFLCKSCFKQKADDVGAKYQNKSL